MKDSAAGQRQVSSAHRIGRRIASADPALVSTTTSKGKCGGACTQVSIVRTSRILEMRRVPIPDPVPPPSECVIWKPCRQSHDSDSLRTTSRTESISSAPSV